MQRGSTVSACEKVIASVCEKGIASACEKVITSVDPAMKRQQSPLTWKIQKI